MAKADSVHSTPRRTAPKIKAKKSAKPAESEEQCNLRHGKAFRDLEGRISDCVTMAGIASQIITNAAGVEGEVVFVVSHASAMLTKLKADYYAAYHGERDMEP